jgi:hypothetical protein
MVLLTEEQAREIVERTREQLKNFARRTAQSPFKG